MFFKIVLEIQFLKTQKTLFWCSLENCFYYLNLVVSLFFVFSRTKKKRKRRGNKHVLHVFLVCIVFRTKNRFKKQKPNMSYISICYSLVARIFVQSNPKNLYYMDFLRVWWWSLCGMDLLTYICYVCVL